MPPEFGGKWGTEFLNTRFPLPTLLCAGYSVKLIMMMMTIIILMVLQGYIRISDAALCLDTKRKKLVISDKWKVLILVNQRLIYVYRDTE